MKNTQLAVMRVTALVVLVVASIPTYLWSTQSSSESVTVATNSGPPPPPPSTVEVATIHFEPAEGDVVANRAALVDLADEAGQQGAKIIVMPEMATSGYSFFSREEIAAVAETVPGPSTSALGAVADQYDAYIAFGMPMFDPELNLYFNVAVLLGPDGDVEGIYKKRNHLLESSYNAQSFDEMPTFDTEYGRLGLVICSDLFYSQFPRATAVQGATMLLAPANVGIDTSFVQLRAFENDFDVVVSNRYGTGTAGTKPPSFSQETFTIPSPFPYDFNWGTRSVIVGHDGTVHADHSAQTDNIGYGTLDVRDDRTLPVVRQPSMYSLLAQDTLESFTQTQFGQPPATSFHAAAVDPGPAGDPWAAALDGAQEAFEEAEEEGYELRLIVFPGDYFTSHSAPGYDDLETFALNSGIDLLIHYAGTGSTPPRSVLIGSDGLTYTYDRTHEWRGEGVVGLSDEYLVVDRAYARVALMQDADMVAPETAHVMSRMGVDVVAVNANSAEPHLSALWESRTGDYLHIVVANKAAPEGIYLGGYQVFPSYTEDEGMVLMEMNTGHIRTKPSARFFDPTTLLEPCDITKDNC